ncbi:hypothetical protein CR492_13400 [Methylocella silvestris]|uniref:Uncharacterized protein n=1 Tax=Methylocella silvestris TaxID=199596 RepID=A0A2J7TFE9_METSI|nr:hypothetical protein CR492_13400 [Methylocella silvestris]
MVVKATDWRALAAHGFSCWEVGPSPQGEGFTAEATGRQGAAVATRSFADLFGQRQAQSPAVEKPKHVDVANGVGVNTISQLNRRQLFFFLKERRIGVRIPITNDRLRALALRAIEFV